MKKAAMLIVIFVLLVGCTSTNTGGASPPSPMTPPAEAEKKCVFFAFGHTTADKICGALKDSGICAPGWVGGDFASIITSWQSLSFIALLISCFVLAIVYMIGTALRNLNAIAWAKNELYQVIVTAIIVGSLVGFASFTCTLDTKILYDFVTVGAGGTRPDPNIYIQACRYLVFLECEIIRLLGYTYMGIFVLGFIVSQRMTYAPGAIGVTHVAPASGLSHTVGSLQMSMMTLTIALLTTMVQIEVFKYIQISMFKVLLPAGVFLRSFGITRRFGGTLMGIAIGLMVVYPALILMNDVAFRLYSVELETGAYYSELKNAEKEIDTIESAAPLDASGNPNIKNLIDIKNRLGRSDQGDAEGIGELEGGTPPVGGYIEPGNPEGMNDTIPNTIITDPTTGVSRPGSMLFAWLFKMIGLVAVAALFLPSINFIVLITAVRELSGLFGMEADITNLTRMI